MRLLADENFPKPIIDKLRADGHDVLWARTDCCGFADVVLLNIAEADARIVVTLDKDFWQLAVQRRTPLRDSSVVLFRVHPATVRNLEPLVRLFTGPQIIWSGHIGIVTADGIQILDVRRI